MPLTMDGGCRPVIPGTGASGCSRTSAGIVLPVVPDPVNLFQDSGPRPDGTLAIGVAASSPGDAVTFLARRDLVVIVTACSVDYPPLNQGHSSPLRIEISPAADP